jgi:hypothetical protein
MGVAFTGVLTDCRLRRREDTAAAMARLKERLPPGQRLVSLGHVDALFRYHYGMPIIPQPWPETGSDPAGDWTYFCFDWSGDKRPVLPFAWEEVAAVPMDRNRHGTPERVVVTGRRLQEATDDPAPRVSVQVGYLSSR